MGGRIGELVEPPVTVREWPDSQGEFKIPKTIPLAVYILFEQNNSISLGKMHRIAGNVSRLHGKMCRIVENTCYTRLCTQSKLQTTTIPSPIPSRPPRWSSSVSGQQLHEAVDDNVEDEQDKEAHVT